MKSTIVNILLLVFVLKVCSVKQHGYNYRKSEIATKDYIIHTYFAEDTNGYHHPRTQSNINYNNPFLQYSQSLPADSYYAFSFPKVITPPQSFQDQEINNYFSPGGYYSFNEEPNRQQQQQPQQQQLQQQFQQQFQQQQQPQQQQFQQQQQPQRQLQQQFQQQLQQQQQQITQQPQQQLQQQQKLPAVPLAGTPDEDILLDDVPELFSDRQSNKLTPASGSTGDSEERDPCVPYDPPKPNFKAPGRRLSEEKCFENIWNNKFRAETKKGHVLCFNKLYGATYDIIDGAAARAGEFPHMGAIGWKGVSGGWVFKCSGSLISAKFVLTAAYCTKLLTHDPDITNDVPEIVRFGVRDLVSPVTGNIRDEKIATIIAHPGYRAPQKYNDIALIELEAETLLNFMVQPACLWPNFDDTSLQTLNQTGWDVIDTATQRTPAELQVTELDLVDTRTCGAVLQAGCNRQWCGLQDNQFCASQPGGATSCQDEIGSPVLSMIPLPSTAEGAIHYVVGVTSFGAGCLVPKSPGVFTRVSSYLDWIEGIVWS